MKSNKNNLSMNGISGLSDSADLIGGKVLNNASEGIELKVKNKETIKSPPKKQKVTNSRREHLKKHLKEDSSIGSTESNKRHHKKTGLEARIATIASNLGNMREEIDLEQIKLRSSALDSIAKNKQSNRFAKLKDSHIECLNRYLIENRYIGNVEVKKRLLQEMGLEVHVTTVHKALMRLRKKLDPEHLILPSSILGIKHIGRKLESSHIKYLKRYLIENESIGNAEAKNRLYKETGLKVSVNCIRDVLIKIKGKLSPECIKPCSSNSVTEVRRKWENLYKLKDLHIEHLKKYLKENAFIGPTEARNRLHKETGLEVSMQTVRTALIKLSEEIDPEYAKMRSSNSVTEVRRRTWNSLHKLKNSHIECLKRYLTENRLVAISEARKRLHQETGLEVSISAIQKALLKLRGKIEP